MFTFEKKLSILISKYYLIHIINAKDCVLRKTISIILLINYKHTFSRWISQYGCTKKYDFAIILLSVVVAIIIFVSTDSLLIANTSRNNGD